MGEIRSIDYSNWNDKKAIKLAESADKDNIKGLNGAEIFDFYKSALKEDMEKEEIFELLGVSIKTDKSNKPKKIPTSQTPELENAINYYNQLNSEERAEITYKTYNNLETRLYNMEKSIDNAFIDCDAYKDIVIIPQRHYRYYPNFNDKLINFNLEEIRNTTAKDMASLQELKEKIEYIIENANGETTHKEVEKTKYDINELAQKHLGMAYDEFAENYKDELEFCKTVTYADFNSMTDTQRMVYSKAKAYAIRMLQTTINEAHTVNWDAGERKLEETKKANDDMFVISEFETADNITEQDLANLKSGIMFNAFQETITENSSTNINNPEKESKKQKTSKLTKNGKVFIRQDDGSIYDISGKRIK